MVVSMESKKAVRKAIAALGRKALPETDVTITPSVMRHQLIADLKATFGAGEELLLHRGMGLSVHRQNMVASSMAGGARATWQ